MSVLTLECRNCGTPLSFPPGARSVTCPSCRTTNYAVALGPGLAPAADAGAKPGQPPPLPASRTDALAAELDRLDRTYHSQFLPAKDQAGRRLDQEMADYEAGLARRPPPRDTSPFVYGAIVFAVMGGLGLVNGGIVETGMIAYIAASRRIPNDALMFGFLAWAAAFFMFIFSRLSRGGGDDPRPRLIADKRRELMSAWQKWQDEDRQYTEKMRNLRDELASRR